MACTYILYSRLKNRFYVGSTRENNGDERLKSHNYGKTKSIKSGCPWVIIHEEKYPTYTEARKRELFLKSGIGRSWIKMNFAHYKLS
ncbi:MAG: GIY-YIG nuclease family protein [Planctomycetota bacterium]